MKNYILVKRNLSIVCEDCGKSQVLEEISN